MAKTARLWCMVMLLLLMSGCRQAPTHTLVEAEGSRVQIPLAEVRDGTAHFYTFRQGRKKINFLVRMDRRGDVHVSLDACYTCSKYRKGFRVDGEEILCTHCGIRFGLSDPAWKVGGCTPIELPHRITEGFLSVEVSDLAESARLF